MTPEEVLTQMRKGQSLWLVFPTHRQAKHFYYQLQDLKPKDVDFIHSQIFLIMRSDNQMKLDTFAKLVTIDTYADICRGSKAIIRFPYPLPQHQNAQDWKDMQPLMERHLVE